MVSTKFSVLAGAAIGAALVLGSAAMPAASDPASDSIVVAQEETAPPAEATEPQAAPDDQSTDSTEAPASGDAEQPSAPPEDDAPSAAPAPENEAPSDGDGATAPPSDDQSTNDHSTHEHPDAAAADSAAPAAASSDISATQLKIGTAVFGSDGTQIGEVNRVKSDDSGKVQEILVTLGGSASINAKVFAVTADKIANVGDSVKLSLSADEAKQLPVIDNSSG
ncbi:photosystem reaction center subunit H [Hyphomicrobium methylovorum]|uniref:PRC-barrel domain-containing protein n=1 Tax=Hyphomicrobium methylovorum TaxID=84 RepID=UPI0015E7AC03|nr:PRC-barrel domain-containing protein [Hyphomicrobium methylovorum]MBA2124816.1 photosystem reaction center subunit H [Hyphomicrobium methylovorum]